MVNHPERNVVYYPIGTRVFWGDKPGTVTAYSLKPYPYPVGYVVQIDGGLKILNAAYEELFLEATKQRSEKGVKVPVPSKPIRVT